MARRISRRALLLSALGLGGAGIAGGAYLTREDAEAITLGEAPEGLPEGQHRWDETSPADTHGHAEMTKHHRLLMLDLKRTPEPSDARRLEAALRTLERHFLWKPAGLLFALGWGPNYFEEHLRLASPIEHPIALADFEDPVLEDYDAALHLASSDEEALKLIEAALFRGAELPDTDGPLDLRPIFELRERRTGFFGEGMPANRQEVAGIPEGNPVPQSSPLFMGFKSGFKGNQATEDDVTIQEGDFAGGTTMHVSRLRLNLQGWYRDLDEQGRVARMHAPQLTVQEVDNPSADGPPPKPELTEEAMRRYGVVGHSQAAARARRNGRPRIIRRDFDTTDGGAAGVHFVSLQREISDFNATRAVMNAAEGPSVNPAVGTRRNNGINAFIEVKARANFIVPTRTQRAFPLLPGRAEALET